MNWAYTLESLNHVVCVCVYVFLVRFVMINSYVHRFLYNYFCKNKVVKSFIYFQGNISSCEICKEVFDDAKQLLKHRGDVHPSIYCYVCQQCDDVRYREKAKLTQHVRLIHKVPVHKCPGCNHEVGFAWTFSLLVMIYKRNMSIDFKVLIAWEPMPLHDRSLRWTIVSTACA